MSFILDALRKSENERQQTAVPGISDVPAVVHRARVPAWLLGLTAGLTACTVLLAWAWLSDLGAGAPEVLAPSPATGETGASVSEETVSVTGGGSIRSLAREARQSAGDERSRESTEAAPAADTPLPADQADPALTMAELLASGVDLPELNLELHVFSATPAERFVFINSAKYLEGERLPEGPRLVRITKDGVILDYRNYSFLLQRE